MDANPTRAEYAEEVKRIFQADRYGWSVEEEEITDDYYDDDIAPEEAASRLALDWAMRRADRNV